MDLQFTAIAAMHTYPHGDGWGIEPILLEWESSFLPLEDTDFYERRREDSNLRYGIAVQQFSKLPPSTTRSLLQLYNATSVRYMVGGVRFELTQTEANSFTDCRNSPILPPSHL